MSIPTRKNFLETESFESLMSSLKHVGYQNGGAGNSNPVIYINFTYNGNVDFITCNRNTNLYGIYSFIYNKLKNLPEATRPVLPTIPLNFYLALVAPNNRNNLNLTLLNNVYGFTLRYNGRDFVEGALKRTGFYEVSAQKLTKLCSGDYYESLENIFDINLNNQIQLEVVLNPLQDRINQSAINTSLIIHPYFTTPEFIPSFRTI